MAKYFFGEPIEKQIYRKFEQTRIEDERESIASLPDYLDALDAAHEEHMRRVKERERQKELQNYKQMGGVPLIDVAMFIFEECAATKDDDMCADGTTILTCLHNHGVVTIDDMKNFINKH